MKDSWTFKASAQTRPNIARSYVEAPEGCQGLLRTTGIKIAQVEKGFLDAGHEAELISQDSRLSHFHTCDRCVFESSRGELGLGSSGQFGMRLNGQMF